MILGHSLESTMKEIQGKKKDKNTSKLKSSDKYSEAFTPTLLLCVHVCSCVS